MEKIFFDFEDSFVGENCSNENCEFLVLLLEVPSLDSFLPLSVPSLDDLFTLSEAEDVEN